MTIGLLLKEAPMTDEEIVATCEAAVARLTNQGWIQEAYINCSKTCLVGALVLVRTSNNYVDEWYQATRLCPAVTAVADVIREFEPNDHPIISHDIVVKWNDQPGRTVDEVIEVLQTTIKRHLPE